MEVVRFGTPNNRPPLLFIHGSYCGAWIWEPYFLPAFNAAGWHGAALSLRGHGKSGGQDKINSFGLADYLQDIHEAVRLFDRAPILIGHSMGGLLAQKYALENPVAGMVLLSSPSLLGLNGSMQHIALHNPMLALQLSVLMTLGPKHVNQRVINEALFNDAKAAGRVIDFMANLQTESTRAALEALCPDFRKPKTHVATLALGGDRDAFIPEFDLRYAAHSWDGQSRILHNVPHGVMLDACWTDVAREAMGWLMGLEAEKNAA